MEQILIASGAKPYTLERLRERWHVTDIHNQQEALEYLNRCEELPAAVMIGFVGMSVEGDLSAREMLKGIQRIDPSLPVIVSTSQVEMRDIVDLVQRGAFDYINEHPDEDDAQSVSDYTEALVLALDRAVELTRLSRENRRLRDEATLRLVPEDVIGRSSSVNRILKLVAKVAPTAATMLITGETGTGKELFARTVHRLSPRREQPFVPVNCGALTENLLASELFGHEKGAFTGASEKKEGLIQEAGNGTLFLDEIGTVTPAFQVMLLRVLENHTARPVGGRKDYGVQCRFVAAANRDLEEMVEEGGFREDLFYRLNMFHIEIPPLRERREDIPALVHYFLGAVVRDYDIDSPGISPAALSMLEEFDWPGNVRQLRNTIERAIILCDSDTLEPGHFHLAGRKSTSGRMAWRKGVTYESAMRQAETQLLRSALAAARGNRSEAARLLDMKRTTFAYRLRQMEIE